jgi:hypothetical protein
VPHAVFTLQCGLQESCPVRVQFFHSERADRAGITSLQESVNTWLRKVRRKKDFRVVNQEVRMTTVTDHNAEEDHVTIVIAVWYEKKAKEVS